MEPPDSSRLGSLLKPVELQPGREGEVAGEGGGRVGGGGGRGAGGGERLVDGDGGGRVVDGDGGGRAERGGGRGGGEVVRPASTGLLGEQAVTTPDTAVGITEPSAPAPLSRQVEAALTQVKATQPRCQLHALAQAFQLTTAKTVSRSEPVRAVEGSLL